MKTSLWHLLDFQKQLAVKEIAYLSFSKIGKNDSEIV